MPNCLPRHYACEWHIPDFEANSKPCILKSFVERRSRLFQDTLFRSLSFGEYANLLTISCTITDEFGDPVLIPIVGQVTNVTVNITDNLTITETYTVTQTLLVLGDPLADPPTSDVWDSAIPKLRTEINGISLLVSMPLEDIQTNFVSINDETFPLNEFNATLMSGGLSGPDSPTNIRTGPIYTLVHIVDSERGNDDGSITVVNETRYYNGACWLKFNIEEPLCDSGEPICAPGPQSECVG